VYHWIRHTSEIELEIEDVDPQAVLTEAVLALSEIFPLTREAEPVTHELEVAAEDLPGLLAAWMHELLRLAQIDGFVPERVEKLRLEGPRVWAVVAGERSTPPRSPIKAVTERRLEMRQLDDGAWSARVVLAPA
jgi:SHS2 domain-containing protein